MISVAAQLAHRQHRPLVVVPNPGTRTDAPRPGKTIQFRDMWMSNPTFIRIG